MLLVHILLRVDIGFAQGVIHQVWKQSCLSRSDCILATLLVKLSYKVARGRRCRMLAGRFDLPSFIPSTNNILGRLQCLLWNRIVFILKWTLVNLIQSNIYLVFYTYSCINLMRSWKVGFRKHHNIIMIRTEYGATVSSRVSKILNRPIAQPSYFKSLFGFCFLIVKLQLLNLILKVVILMKQLFNFKSSCLQLCGLFLESDIQIGLFFELVFQTDVLLF